jgi:OFA family oxalate/formate antiporter-like MFS transporter
MLSGALNRKMQSRTIYWIIAAISLVGFCGTSAAKGIWGIYLFYGVFSGLAIGMIYNLVLTVVTAQFESNLSLVSGILLMGFGVGPLVLGMAAAALLGAVGWRYTFAVLAVVYASILVAASLLIPSRKNQDEPAAGNTGGVKTGQMLKNRPYQYFFLWCVVLGSAVLILIGHSSLISRDIGASVATASLMTGVVSVASGVSRPFFGRLADTKGSSALKDILAVCCALGSVAVFAGYIGGSMVLLALGYVLTGAANGGNAVYICSFVQERYGNAHYGMNMAVANIYMILGSLFGTALAGTIKTQTGSYTFAFVVMMAFSALSILFGLLLGRAQRSKKTS